MNQIETNKRLNEISFQLGTLRNHLQLVEKQIAHNKIIEKRRLDKLIRKLKERCRSDDDQEILYAIHNYDYIIEFLLPRFLRASFLVSLYAVYESSIRDVAEMMKERQSLSSSIDDERGNLLEKAKEYYNRTLNFDLCVDKEDWDRIIMLLELRNAVSHANGRIARLNVKTQKKISMWESQKIGLSVRYGYLIIGDQLAENLYKSVRATLSNLRARYQKWKRP